MRAGSLGIIEMSRISNSKHNRGFVKFSYAQLRVILTVRNSKHINNLLISQFLTYLDLYTFSYSTRKKMKVSNRTFTYIFGILYSQTYA